ncbi:MAG: chemotaxis protein CheX [Firmicutes bacterium]|jgi:chemotaxis protein CheX|nr:chemotaxis protein CheX [Candidatus Fermentithermobacillaceae bacterium]
MLRAELVNPFLEGAITFFKQELSVEISRGRPWIKECRSTSQEISVLVGVTGEAKGFVLYSMNERTAKNIASAMLGSPVPLYDQLAESALGEMGNIITGQAASRLEHLGYVCKLSPPALITGEGTVVSTLDIKMLVIPVELDYLGIVNIYVALKGTAIT